MISNIIINQFNTNNKIIDEFKKNKFNFLVYEEKMYCKNIDDFIESNIISTFPPCINCNKNECNCTINYLTRYDLNKWNIYITIMKDIINNKYKDFVIIYDGNIKFSSDWVKTYNNLKELSSYNINLNKPLLLRLGSKSNKNKKCLFKFVKNSNYSNYGILINKKYAQIFIENLKIINCTCYSYIHNKLLSLNKSIENFICNKYLIYETVQIKKQSNRKEFRKFKCIGHPRCGTCTVSKLLLKMGHKVGHESIDKDGISSWMLAVNEKSYPYGSIEMKSNSMIDKYYFANIIHVIRDPFKAIPSIILENKYPKSNNSYNFRKEHIKKCLNINLPYIKGDDKDNFTLLQEVELAIKTYIYWNKICEMNKPSVVIKIEDLGKLNIFNKNKIDISQIQKTNYNSSSDKKFNNKLHNKPEIPPEIWNKINPQLKYELNLFCNKYNYTKLNDLTQTEPLFS